MLRVYTEGVALYATSSFHRTCVGATASACLPACLPSAGAAVPSSVGSGPGSGGGGGEGPPGGYLLKLSDKRFVSLSEFKGKW